MLSFLPMLLRNYNWGCTISCLLLIHFKSCWSSGNIARAFLYNIWLFWLPKVMSIEIWKKEKMMICIQIYRCSQNRLTRLEWSLLYTSRWTTEASLEVWLHVIPSLNVSG
jgi:hypothetical protein